MTDRRLFVWGTIGALLPQVLSWKHFVDGTTQLPTAISPLFALVWLVITFIYTFGGGAVAVAYRGDTDLKALWVGASFPALIATLAQQLPALPK